MSFDKLRFWERSEFDEEAKGEIGGGDHDHKEIPMTEIEDLPESKRRRRGSFACSSSSSASTVHPLLIDHVLENILNFGDFNEAVKQFRLVCKHWNQIATKAFRTKHGRITFENDFSRKTAKFIEVMKKSNDIPFDKFKFCGGFVVYKPYKGHYEYDKIFNELFKVCVPYMKSMEFTSHNPSDLKFPKDLKAFKDQLSQLKSLSFHVCVYYESLQTEMVDFLATLFLAAPHLTKLDFRITSVDPSQRNKDQLELIKRFGDLICTKIPKTCKHLKLNMLLSEEQLLTFGEQGLKLESLRVDFQKCYLQTSALKNFFESQSKSLQFLELIDAPLSLSMEFPVLENLHHVRIEGKPAMPSFNFEKVFPKLKSIEILFYWIYQDDNWLKDIFVENGRSKSVLEVDFLCDINDNDNSVLFRIAKCFPSMKRLSVVIDSLAALTTLFSTMQFVEELEMSLCREFWRIDHGIVDEAFTGVPAEICVLLLQENSFVCTDMPCTLRKPSLRDLKKLKRLKIRAFHPENIPLTDITVHYGLMKMESLEELTLDVFPISKQSLQILERKFDFTLLPGPPTLP